VDSPLHFRPVQSVRLKASDGRRVKHNLKHTARQIWVDFPADGESILEAISKVDVGALQFDSFPRKTSSLPRATSRSKRTKMMFQMKRVLMLKNP
jgi:hypothetical protein